MLLRPQPLPWATLILLTSVVLPKAHAQVAPPADLQTPCGSTTYQYSRLSVMNAIKTRPSNLTLVAAHRGYWEQYPENSKYSILAAGYCYEIVEADLKPLAGNGIAVAHDLVLNRTTTLSGALNQTRRPEFRNAYLRDRHGVVTTMHPIDGQDLIDMYAKYVATSGSFGGFVLALDVKGADPVNDPWPLLKNFHTKLLNKATSGNQLADSILYKIEAKALPQNPADVTAFINLNPNVQPLNLYIVYNDISELPIMNAYTGQSFVAGSEVNFPYRGSPIEPILSAQAPVGTFSTYYDLPEGVGNSKGRCCGVLNTDTNNGAAKIDYRGRYDDYAQMKSNAELNTFNLFTTDRPDVMVNVLTQLNLRNTTSILK